MSPGREDAPAGEGGGVTEEDIVEAAGFAVALGLGAHAEHVDVSALGPIDPGDLARGVLESVPDGWGKIDGRWCRVRPAG